MWEGIAVGRQDLTVDGKGTGTEGGLLRVSLTLLCLRAGTLGCKHWDGGSGRAVSSG